MKQTTPQKTQVNKRKPNKYSNLNTISDSYKEYSKQYPNRKVDKKLYTAICIEFFKECLVYMLEGCEVRLPLLGVLSIVKKKRDLNKLQPDWKSTKELWSQDPDAKRNKKLVFHMNNHSGGYYYRFHWRKGKVKNISVYSFLPVRAVKTALSSAILSGNKDYIR
jgi:hypothetical protein